jgi:hypothetical protein
MKSFLLGALCALSACAHLGPAPAGPEGAARAYADALEQGRLDTAFAISTGLDEARFRECYSDAKVRARRAAAVRLAAEGTAAGGSLKLVLEGGFWRVQELEPAKPVVQEEAREVLTKFLDLADGGDFEGALSLLGAQWRSRYTAQRFREDFAREPLAKERLQRARAALNDGRWIMGADGAQLPLGGGHSVRLWREADGFKVVALE